LRFPFALALAAAVFMLAACGNAPRQNAGNEAAGTSSGHSGVEVFGTVDAAVSGSRTRSAP
jgi:hypothetical protein